MASNDTPFYSLLLDEATKCDLAAVVAFGKLAIQVRQLGDDSLWCDVPVFDVFRASREIVEIDCEFQAAVAAVAAKHRLPLRGDPISPRPKPNSRAALALRVLLKTVFDKRKIMAMKTFVEIHSE